MNRKCRFLTVLASLGFALGLMPTPPARGDPAGIDGYPLLTSQMLPVRLAAVQLNPQPLPPVVTRLVLPVRGVVNNPPCAAVPLAGSIFALVVAHIPPNPCTPGAPLLVQVRLAGVLFGTTEGGQQFVATIEPLEATIVCSPPNPCAPISFQLRLFAAGSPILTPPGPINHPPNPCREQSATGTLTLTLRACGESGFRWL